MIRLRVLLKQIQHIHIISQPHTTILFEGIAKTNTTHTKFHVVNVLAGLRVLLKQIQHIQMIVSVASAAGLRVLLKQIQHIHIMR